MRTILVVDDDQHVRQLISKYLGEQGFRVIQASDGNEALHLLDREDIHLAVVDIMMPNMDGFAFMKKMRAHDDLPVMMLTAKGQIKDKEKAYSLGSDDYLVKPFELKELLFRIKALLRRYHHHAEAILELGNVIINKLSFEVQIDSQTLLLPLKEFELLYTLAANHGRVLTREQLIRQVWGSRYEGNDRTVDVHIKRLRERLNPLTDALLIKTIRGVGYSLEVQT